jgi:septum formation protein
MNRRFVLASGSPRRRELLGSLGIDFEVIVSNFNEDSIDSAQIAPNELVRQLATSKALDVARNLPGDALVLGADTVVALEGKILGKPKTEEEAVEMLLSLSGKTHQVYTGVALIESSEGSVLRQLVDNDMTEVEFMEFDRAKAAAYVAAGESMDKAGAYGIQALGTLLIPRINGDYFNVVGLPLHRLGLMLESLGVKLL